LRGVAYVNGEFTPLSEARVSVLDRGFLFADGVYEVAAVLDGRLVDNDAHLARLERSLGELVLHSPVSTEQLRNIQQALIERNGVREGLVYIQITRGAAERDFAFPKDAAPTLVMFTQAKNILGSPAAKTGVGVISVPDLRWARRDIKSVSLLAQVLAKQAAAAQGCAEAWMVDAQGFVTEGSSSTAYIVTKAGAIVTRPNSQDILPGCTRRALQTLAQRNALAFDERGFTVAEAHDADEAFLTSASSFVTPIVAIDGQPVGAGAPGPLAQQLRALYIKFARAQ
jgi:D-alanine transaminase